MSVVEIDERGRMTVPKKLGLRKSRAIIIPAGSFFVTIPLPKDPERRSGKMAFHKQRTQRTQKPC